MTTVLTSTGFMHVNGMVYCTVLPLGSLTAKAEPTQWEVAEDG